MARYLSADKQIGDETRILTMERIALWPWARIRFQEYHMDVVSAF
jgi:hypothetical protein